MSVTLRVGTSAFTAAGWPGTFYPQDLKPAEYLSYYAQHFDAVEVDSTYYRIPSISMTRGWNEKTPKNFLFALKIVQTITHEKVLVDCEDELKHFLAAADALGEKLGPLLFQFPYFNKKAFATVDEFLARLAPFLKKLPKGYRFTVEVRNKSWLVPKFVELLRERGVALALIDHPWMPRPKEILAKLDPITADFTYIRWLGDRKGIEEQTTTWDKTIVDRRHELVEWVETCRKLSARSVDIFAFANNHYAGHAPATIRQFLELWREKWGCRNARREPRVHEFGCPQFHPQSASRRNDMKKRMPWLAILVVAAVALPLLSQEREDRTLLNWTQMRAIINEASGERALHHLLEMVPYPRVRAKAEYEGTFRESEVMARFAREYGFSGVEIETFPTQGRSWFASQAELWMVEPESRKLYDVYDVAIAIAGNSETGDVTAELVDVGFGGRAEDYAGKDVKGKIVLGSAGTNVLQRMAVFERDAVGVIGYNTVRPISDLDQILSQGVSANAPQGKKPGFGWAISPRVARELAMRLRNEKIVMRSIVKSEFVPGEMETVHAMIPGDGSTEQDIIVSGHLYEGYLKQGANDDGSGCAVTLEMGRTLIRLINEGKLPKPKRNIHFLWVPEISGTNAWLNKHADIKKRLIADLNFDMEGLHLSRSGSIFTMNRTPDSFPSFLNDIGASLMDFVAATNRERVQYRANGYRFTLPITAPNGSNDPFWASVDKHYGASDHVVYMNQGIPAVIFCTWPDTWYHSSQDTPDKMDSTQFKRVAVIGAAGAIIMAAADDDLAARVAAESLARGTERMGAAQRKGLSYLADVTDSAALVNAYREARVTVSHQANVEKEVVRSAAVLFINPEEAKKKLSALEALVDQRGASLQNEVKAFYQLSAEQKKVPAAEPTTSELMMQAAKLIPESVGGPGGGGFGGGGGGGGGAPGQQPAAAGGPQLSAEERAALQAAMRKVPQHMGAELNALLTRNAARKRTVLEIRDFLSGEFEPLPLEDLMGNLKAREKLGTLKFTEKPEEPKPAPAKKGSKPAKKP